MSALLKLGISNLRNIDSAEINPGKTINLIYGENGSGKSSFLEAIYLLGMARSFRGNTQNPIIQNSQDECTIFGELTDGQTLGLSRHSRKGQLTKVSGRKSENVAELARCLPIQLINSDTFKILEGSPKVRRHYLDWGVFHVEHRFIEQWRMAQRALKNRNRLLKLKASMDEIEPWSIEFVKHAEEINKYRESYVQSLLPIFSSILSQLLPMDELSLEYDRGWDSKNSLLDLLKQGIARDIRYGYTVPGPQRADIKIKFGQHFAVDILSRGQQKLLVSALKIAQGSLLELQSKKQCLYLIDDLPSELDKVNRGKVCQLLDDLNGQVYITLVEKESLSNTCWDIRASTDNEMKLFHVKHGKIKEENMVQ